MCFGLFFAEQNATHAHAPASYRHEVQDIYTSEGVCYQSMKPVGNREKLFVLSLPTWDVDISTSTESACYSEV